MYNAKGFLGSLMIIPMSRGGVFYAKCLLICALCTAVICVILSYHNNEDYSILPDGIAKKNLLKLKNSSESVISGTSISTIDGRGNLFCLSAKNTAYDYSKIKMDDIQINMMIGNNHGKDLPATIKAKAGSYCKEQKKVQLNKQVQIKTGDGKIIDASSVTIDYEQGVCSSHKPVSVKFNSNKIEADSFEMNYGKNKIISFKGNAKAEFSLD